jgi:predicted ATPase/class 3 adenylate cyclase
LLTPALTFLFTDIEGSTALLQRVGEEVYAEILAQHHSIIRAALADFGGEEVGTQGDGFLAVFSSPKACVAAVVEMQRAIQSHPWCGGERIRVRMGVHTGEVVQTSTGLVGLAVHRAARVAAVAYGGQVLLSDATAALVRDALASDVVLRDLGEHRLKDLGRPERIWQVCAEGLPAEFPPVRSLDNPALRNNLPAELASFVGRERELAELRRLIAASRLVTLCGTGGAGKTRLAVHVAAELLDGTGDGVWLVELAPLSDPELVASAIAGALQIPLQPRRQVIDGVTDALASQSALIVLDNCEHLLDACAKATEVILRRCPHIRLVATSREPLGTPGETIYRVPSMSLPSSEDTEASDWKTSDAVTLFIERASAQGVEVTCDGDSGGLLISICRRLDGMPLALELAAARTRSMSLIDLSARLDQRFRLLTGGSRNSLDRHQTLRATIDWSYALLDATERRLFRRLSVFADSFDLEAVEKVCGLHDIDQLDVAALLGSLVDKSLVLPDRAGATLRYRLLETLRQYAAERLLEAGEAESGMCSSAHSNYYLSVAEAAAPRLECSEQEIWIARLDSEAANLRGALMNAIEAVDGRERVVRMTAALRRYWLVRHPDDELLGLLAPILDRDDLRGDLGLAGLATATVALQARALGFDHRRSLGQRAVKLSQQSGDDRPLIEALAVLATILSFAGKGEQGCPYAEEAVSLARSLHDDRLLATSIGAYLLCTPSSSPDLRRKLFGEAIDCTTRSGDHLFNYLLHNNAGVEALRTGDLVAARSHLLRAQEGQEALGFRSHHVSGNLGWVSREEHDFEAARAHFEESLRISRHDGDRGGLAYSCLGLACISTDTGLWEKAVTLHGLAQGFLEYAEEYWQSPEVAYRSSSLEAAREHLGAHDFESRYLAAKALGFHDALAKLLETTFDRRRPPQHPNRIPGH